MNNSITKISNEAWDACCDGEWLGKEFPEYYDIDIWDGEHDDIAIEVERTAQEEWERICKEKTRR